MDLVRAAWIEYERDRARYLAVAMIYYAIVSLVPLLLLLLAALGLVLRFSAVAAQLQQQMLAGIAAGFGPELPVTIERLLDTLQQDSIVATVISLAGLLLTASVLFRHLRLGFRAIWRHEPPLVSGPVRDVVRATILERAIAFVMVLAGGGLLLTALGLIAATQWLDRLLYSLPLFGRITGWLLATSSSLVLAPSRSHPCSSACRRFGCAGATSGSRRCCAQSAGWWPASCWRSRAPSSATG
jgi:membrane protein